MTSNIDPTYPTAVSATTQSVRDNFSAAKTEILALQTSVSAADSAITSVNTVVASLSSTVSSNYAFLVSAAASVSVRVDTLSATVSSNYAFLVSAVASVSTVANNLLKTPLVLTNQTSTTTVGAAGGATALPLTPLGYITISINGTEVKVPFYNV